MAHPHAVDVDPRGRRQVKVAQGTMDEEYLFWDNQEFMKQIGLGK